MEIVIGKSAGFCYGVKNAVESAKSDLELSKGRIYFLGDIVHNKQVIEEFKSNGAVFVEDINEVPTNSTVIVRAHGIEQKVHSIAEQRKIELKDYTCPNVLKIHRIAEEYAKLGYYILLFGTKKHPENIGTISYCADKYFIIEDEVQLFNAIDVLNQWNVSNVLVISQTTFNLETFYTFQEILRDELNKNINLIIKNTICNATQIRQQETEQISKEVDFMIIIGGKNSSNTKKLLEIAEEYCKGALCVETKEELKGIDLSLFKKIGIMAGASTPKESIDDVFNFVNDRYNK